MKFNLLCIILLVSFISVITANPCAESTDGDLIDNPESCDEYYYCFNGIPQPRLCAYPEKFDPINKICISDYLCDSMERYIANNTLCNSTGNNVIINNPESCAGFFFCFENTAIYGNCPWPLHFDENRTMCDHQENVNCQEPTQSPTTTVNPLCYYESNFALIDNPYVCDGFFICINGYPHEGNCPHPLFFNPKTRECDFRDNVYCANYTTTEYPLTTPGYNYCTGIANDVLVDNPNDCEGFFLCFDEIPFPGTCPYPLYFNPIINACDHRNNVTCNTNTTTNYCENAKDFELVNNPQSCSAYFLCFMGNSIHQECPPPFYFNELYQICDFPENVNCTSVCEGVKNGTLVSDVNDKQGFYICVGGIGIHHRCPDGYYFNETNQDCSFLYYTTSTIYSNSTETTPMPTTNMTSTPYNTTTTPYDTTTAPYNTTTTEGYETTTFSLCYGIADYTFIADPHNCDGWYFCVDQIEIGNGRCPEGFHFNAALQGCDYPENVNCNITTSTATYNTTILTTLSP